jgi:hypothetical protein
MLLTDSPLAAPSAAVRRSHAPRGNEAAAAALLLLLLFFFFLAKKTKKE